MPIVVDADLCRISQQEFGAIAYDVMESVFADAARWRGELTRARD